MKEKKRQSKEEKMNEIMYNGQDEDTGERWPDSHSQFVYSIIYILMIVLGMTILLSLFVIHNQYKIMAKVATQWNESTVLRIPDDGESYYIEGNMNW